MTTRAPAPADSPEAIAAAEKLRRRRRWRRVRWTVRALVLLGAFGYLKFVGFDSKFYYPNQTIYVQPQELGLKAEDVFFPTSDGQTLHGLFLPAVGRPRGLVVHFHGNAANVTAHLALTYWLPEAGYHVLMFDYRGFGRSTGRVTRAGTIQDGLAAVDYALSRPEARGVPLLAYGQSLGGAVAVVVAAERPEIKALVAESTFSSYRDVAGRHAARLVKMEWLGRALASLGIARGYDPIDYVARVAPRPVLIVAAENDEICFPAGAADLFAAAGEPKTYWVARGAGHLEITDTHLDELRAKIEACFNAAARQ